VGTVPNPGWKHSTGPDATAAFNSFFVLKFFTVYIVCLNEFATVGMVHIYSPYGTGFIIIHDEWKNASTALTLFGSNKVTL